MARACLEIAPMAQPMRRLGSPVELTAQFRILYQYVCFAPIKPW